MSRRGGAGQVRQRDGGEQVKGQQREGRSAAEWTSLGISAAIVLSLISLVTYQQLTRGSRPPAIEVTPRLQAVRQAVGVYYVPVDIANRGDQTAEAVRVRLVHSSDGGRQQSSELEIDYLAGGATAHGTAVFREDPATGRLEVEMLSFLDP